MAVSLETWSGIKATLNRYYKPDKLKLYPIDVYYKIMEQLIFEMMKGRVTNFIATHSKADQKLKIVFTKAKCFKPITLINRENCIVISQPCVEKFTSWKSQNSNKNKRLKLTNNLSIENLSFTTINSDTNSADAHTGLLLTREDHNLIFIKLLKIILLIRNWYYCDFLKQKIYPLKISDIV